MEKETFIMGFNASVEKNFEHLQPYYNHNLKELTELRTLKFEILNCLMLGFDQASICTTNHFLERALKLSLIHLYTLGLHFGDKEFNHKMQEAHNKYDTKKLPQSVKLALDAKLITNNEFEILTKMKTKFRDSYSHAEMETILDDVPKFIQTLTFNFDSVKSNIQNKTPIEQPLPVNYLNIAFAQHFQEQKAKAFSLLYFKDVYNIVMGMDERLTAMRPKID